MSTRCRICDGTSGEGIAVREMMFGSRRAYEWFRRMSAGTATRILDVEDDSTEFQFAGSELYRRDIPLTELGSHWTASRLRSWRREAQRLNREKRGDQAAFYLRHRIR